VETAAPQEGNTEMKRVVTVNVGATKSAEAPRRKRIRTNPAEEANEQK